MAIETKPLLGGILGPASAVDNEIPRFDDVSGQVLQRSGVTIDDDDNVTIPGRISIEDGQIVFPATQNPSADVNTLDDYEEGTFTPIIRFGGSSVGITYGSTHGFYTKIGNLVMIQGLLTLTYKATLSGVADIGGLPFASGSTEGLYSTCLLEYDKIVYSDVFQSRFAPNQTVIWLSEVQMSGARTRLNNGDFNNDSQILFSMTYRT